MMEASSCNEVGIFSPENVDYLTGDDSEQGYQISPRELHRDDISVIHLESDDVHPLHQLRT